MEQIDLVLIIANQYSRWSEDDEFERNEKLARFPYSVQVATSFMEMDFVEEWLTNVIGPKRISWEVVFYYKQDYDFGYAEYFFHAESSSIIFKNQLPKIFGVFADGKKLRTNCQGEYFEAEH
jgi:hypothetical protein